MAGKDAVPTPAQERVWKLIRIIPEFNFRELAVLTELQLQTVSSYLLILWRAGYIRPAGNRKTANGKRHKVWRLVKNTGPKTPYPCRCLYDPNLDDLAEVKPDVD
jgi:hypothetical protein